MVSRRTSCFSYREGGRLSDERANKREEMGKSEARARGENGFKDGCRWLLDSMWRGL